MATRSKFLGREAILAAKLPVEEVYVEEWGGTVLLRPLTVRVRSQLLDAIDARQHLVDAYEADQALPVDERAGLAKVTPLDQTIVQIIMAIVDDKQQPVFSIDADYELFEDLSAATLTFLYRTLMAMERRDKFSRSEQKKS